MSDTLLNVKKKLSVFKLIADLPGLLIELAKAEIEHAKGELATKAKAAALGVGLFAAAAFLAFFLLAVLITAAILGLSEAVAPWLAALIVAGVLLILIAVLVLVGVQRIKKGVPPTPEETIDSVKKDVQAIKGVGEYEH